MSEVLKKYRERNKYLQNLTEAYKELVASIFSRSRDMVRGHKDMEEALDRLVARVKTAENIFQVEQLRKDYVAISKKIDACVKEKTVAEKGGGLFSSLGSLFAGKAEQAAPAAGKADEKAGKKEEIELVDATAQLLFPYITLLDGFSKGTLLIADERETFYSPLKTRRSARFENLKEDEADSLSRSLYTFFINKSNEASVVEQEKEELKIIIASLATYIQSLSVSSESFGSKLDEYARKVTAATTLNEIKKIQHAILTETLEIQKVNGSVRDQLAEANKKMEEASEKIARLEKELEMARQEKSVDALTRVYNRGYFDERLKEAVAQFSRTKEPCSLILLDIDEFKKFNDSYGHQAGDQVLTKVAELVKESVRASDTVARYGGEEFAVILYKAKLKDAMKMAEKIRKEVNRHEFVTQDKVIKVTVSIGLTEFSGDDSPQMIVQRADKGLYAAKEQGRNKCVQIPA